MKKRYFLIAAGALLVLGAGLSLRAQSDFPPLDIKGLLAQAKDYQHRANVLRKMIGVRDRQIGSMQQQADSMVAQAQAAAQAQAQAAAQAQGQAQSDSGLYSLFNTVVGQMPGGSSLFGQAMQGLASGMGSAETSQANAQAQQAQAMGGAETSQAQQSADSLMAQAQNFQGEKKKLAYKAKQYEELADAKQMLAASEILRLQAIKESGRSSSDDKTIADERRFVQSLAVW